MALNEVVDFEAARWAKWKSYAVKRAQQNGTTVEHEVAEGLRLRAWLRSVGYKRVSAPFQCERPPFPIRCQMSEPISLDNAAAFLRDAAHYFEHRPTGGEDAAHWSNVQNAENCRRVADLLAALSPGEQDG